MVNLAKFIKCRIGYKMEKDKEIHEYVVKNMTIKTLSIDNIDNIYNIVNNKKSENKQIENKKGETLLIIGNGFDLAHGLPTSYKDFLHFCQYVELIFEIEADKDKQKRELENQLNKELGNLNNEKEINNNIDKIKSELDKVKNHIDEIYNQETYKKKLKNELEKWNPKQKTKEENIKEINNNIDESIDKINKYIEKINNKENVTNDNKQNEKYEEWILKNSKEYYIKIKKIINKLNQQNNKENNFDSEQKTSENTEIIKKKLEAFLKYKEKTETTNEINSDEIEAIDKIHDLIKENFWYQYLVKIYRQNRIKNNNWVDFESEIKHVIKKIDKKSENNLLTKFQKLFPKIQKKDPKLKNLYFDRELENINIENTTVIKDCKTVKDFREKSYEALLEFTRALELYFAVFIENKEIIENQIKLQIDNSDDNRDDQKDIFFDFPTADYIINFNYTNTYERYSNNQDNKKKICYIHGKCDSQRNIKENNMVLGIDNYWEEAKEESKKDKGKDKENKRDNYINFTIFRKFAQRIQKQTDNSYYEYLQNIRKWEDIIDKNKNIKADDEIFYNIHIFGHSLDVTDKDILEKFISSKVTNVTIYSHKKEEIGNLIANTIKLIGKEKFQKKLRKGKIKYLVYKPLVDSTNNQNSNKQAQ